MGLRVSGQGAQFRRVVSFFVCRNQRSRRPRRGRAQFPLRAPVPSLDPVSRARAVGRLFAACAFAALGACGGGGGGGGSSEVPPTLSVSVTHQGSFTQGQQNATYSIVVSNATGATATQGAVNVLDLPPPGLTFVSAAGSGWSCQPPPSQGFCSQSASLPGGSSYPALTVTVNVDFTVTSPVVNSVTVSGGGPNPPVTATDSTTIVPATPQSLSITSGDSQSGTVGSALAAALTVLVGAVGGHPLPGAQVSWAVTAGGGSLDQSKTATASDGSASVHLTLGTAAGANTVSAAVGGLPSVTFSATATPGPPTSLLLANPKNPLATSDVVQLAISAADRYGNAAPPPPLTWAVTVDGRATVVTVSSSGMVTAVAPGAAVIHASGGGLATTLPVVVNGKITFAFGAEEVVFRHATDSCEPSDIPDVPARAVRLADGSLLLLSGAALRFYATFGVDFASLKHSCTLPVLSSDDSPNANTFDNQEWIHSLYRVGTTIHALIHNEFHDPVAADCTPGVSSPNNPCWYNSITYAASTDGGHTFTHAAPPAHVVAPPPIQWNPGPPPPPPYGYFSPSNIVLATDGYYYTVFGAINPAGTAGLCVMRTQVLADPTSWRAWDGSGFNLPLTNPYTGTPGGWCSYVTPAGGGVSLTYNRYLGLYMEFGDVAAGNGCGIFFYTSPDLIHWTSGGFMRAHYWRAADIYSSSQCGAPPGVASEGNSAIIDHADATINFEQPGQNAYLYYTRFNSGYSLDRDLVRVPMAITSH